MALLSATILGGVSGAQAATAQNAFQSLTTEIAGALNSDSYAEKVVGYHLQNIEGSVTTPTCTISFPGDVMFDAVSLAEVKAANNYDVLKTQGGNIELTDCKPNTRYQYRVKALGDSGYPSNDGQSSVYKEDGTKFNGLKVSIQNSSNQELFTDGSLRGLGTTDGSGTSVVPINVKLMKDGNTSTSVDTGVFRTALLYVISQQ